MTQEEFYYQCIDVIDYWLNSNRILSDLREVTDKLYNEVTKPHWISMEDELPPRWETNPNVSVPVITCKFVNRELQDIDLQRYVFGESKWQYGDATHWMPFQFPEKGDGE